MRRIPNLRLTKCPHDLKGRPNKGTGEKPQAARNVIGCVDFWYIGHSGNFRHLPFFLAFLSTIQNRRVVNNEGETCLGFLILLWGRSSFRGEAGIGSSRGSLVLLPRLFGISLSISKSSMILW